MGYAGYIGRVGGLAAALGVSAAVAGWGGTAWADDIARETTTESGEDAGPASPTSALSTARVTPDVSDATGTVGTVATAESSAGPPSTNPATPGPKGLGLHYPRVIVRSSGGALPEVLQSTAAAVAPDPDISPAPESLTAQPVSDSSESAPIELPAPPAHDARPVVRPVNLQVPDSPALVLAHKRLEVTRQISAREQAGVDDLTAATVAATDTGIEGLNSAGMQSADATALASPSIPVMEAAAADPGTQAVSGLLTAIGLNPDAADTPVPAPALPTLLDFVQMAWTEFLRTFFNQTPTLAYKPTENGLLVDGRIVGDLHPTDPDSPNLTYTATDPAHGDVVVHPDGTFTYTPDAGYTGPDSFDVTVSDVDNGFHIHGLSGLLNLFTFGLLGDKGDTYTQHIAIGFERTALVSGLNEPVDFRFLSDGRILIAEKSGTIRVYKDGQLLSQPLAVLSVSTLGERGITGFAVDPSFQNNGYIYVAYTTAANRDRLSRFTVTGDTANPASELVLMESTQLANDNHHGGAVAFGADGKLYWAVGDNSNPANSQDLSNIHGKIVRLNPDGTVPSDNPFINTPGALPQIYALGFRNPYRFTTTPDGKLIVADVGQVSWEELDVVTAGGNYGWPNAEGACTGCSYVNPIYTYPHTGAGAAITSVLVYTGTTFGTSYQNKVFIADLVQGWIKVLTCTSDYSSCGSETVFENQAGTTVELVQGPDGNIYQLTVYPGVLSRIAPSGAPAPTAAVLT